MTEPSDFLLESVLALTDPYETPLDEPARNRWGARLTSIKHPCRIDQLVAAITPSKNSGGGGALAREKNVIDTGALDLHQRLLRDVNAAATHVGAPTGDDPAAVLKWWLLTARTKHPTDAFENEWSTKWETWADRIDNHLNPPVLVEIMRPCPICGEVKAIDPNAAGGPAIVTALVVQYRRGGAMMLDEATAMCRFCQGVWQGRDAIRSVAFDIEQDERDGAA